MPDLEPITREEMLLDGQDLEPITRKEMFIKRIYDKTQVIPEPITREEMFLKKAGDETIDVTIEQLNVSENGTYSEEGKAYSPVIVNVPAPPIPDNAYLLNEVEGLPKDIVTFNDGSALPMPSLKVGIEPQQDLHGYDSPWVGGSGKNKFDQDTAYASYKQSDGGFRITGNAVTLMKNYIPQSLVGQQVTVSVYFDLTKEASPNGVRIACNIGGTETESSRVESNQKKTLSLTFTPTATTDYWYITYGNTGANYFTFKDCQLEIGSSATTFAPYSNICPISGHTEANVTRCGKNLWNNNWSAYTQPSDYRICPIKLENGQYTASVKLKEGGTRQSGFTLGIAKQGDRYSSFGSFYTASTGADKTGTITVDDAWTSPKLIIYCNNESAFNAIFENYEIQLEKGTTATTYEPYNGQTYTIQFRDGDNPLTVYGGSLDVVSGMLTVDRVYKQIKDLEWQTQGGYYGRFYATPSGADKALYDANKTLIISDTYKGYSDVDKPTNTNGVYVGSGGNIKVWDSEYTETTDIDAWKTARANVELCYYLATPTTIQLTPTQVKSLLGSNNVWADTGEIEELEYFSKEA